MQMKGYFSNNQTGVQNSNVDHNATTNVPPDRVKFQPLSSSRPFPGENNSTATQQENVVMQMNGYFKKNQTGVQNSNIYHVATTDVAPDRVNIEPHSPTPPYPVDNNTP